MKFPEEQYYRLNYVLLSLIGLWSFENFIIRQIKFVLSLLLYVSVISVQLIAIFVSEYNLDFILGILSTDTLIIMWFVKYITFYAVLDNIKELRSQMRNNWGTLTDDYEIDIMHKYAHVGKLFTVTITSLVLIGMFVYILTQYIPNLLDVVVPLNESRPRKLVIMATYFVDQQKYFHILAIHTGSGMFLTVTTGSVAESFVLANALHAFAMFKVARYRMERILSGNSLQMCTSKNCALFRDRIIAAVDSHKRAIEFSELLRINFGRPYLFLFVLSVCSSSINLFHLLTAMTEQEIIEAIKSSVFIFFHLLFLVIGNFAGQEFINSDSNVHRAICDTQWYDAPLKTQKLILFLIQKTTKTYKVDAGGLFSPSSEGLASGLSLLLSFSMVLYSVQ